MSLLDLSLPYVIKQAQAAQTAAQTARLAAEAARDSVNSTGKVFADTAAGIAGTTNGQTFSVLSTDLTSWIVYKNNAGAALEVARSYTKSYMDSAFRPQGEGVAAQAMRLRDALGRIVLELSEDANVGLTARVPINLLPGSVPSSVLDATTLARLPTALVDQVVGYLLRIKDASGRLILGLPQDGSQPISAYVTRAATADSGGCVVAETSQYYVEAFSGAGGVMQLRAHRKLDNIVTWTTSGTLASTSPTATPDGKILYQMGGAVYSVDPADGISYPSLPSTDLVLYGDSMTAPGSGYGATLAALYPSRTTYNAGIGGQRTSGIAARFGVPGLTLAITGNAIPTAGSVSCVPNILLLNNPGGSTSAVLVSVGGVTCNLAQTSGAYTLTPLAYPASAVAVPNPAPATVMTGFVDSGSATLATPLSTHQTGVVIIRAGKNDVTKADYDKAATLASIASMVDAIKSRAKAVLVLGVTNGYADLPVALGGSAPSDATSDLWLASVADFNTTLAGIYGARFLDPLANHVALGGATAQTVNGHNYMVLNNTILSDGTHENATGWARTAALVQAAINSKGY